MMLLTSLPILLIGGYSFYTTIEALRETALKDQQNQLTSSQNSIEVLLGNAERDLLFLRDSSAMKAYLNKQQTSLGLGQALEQFVQQQSIYSSVRLLDLSGQEIVYVERLNGVAKSLTEKGDLLDQSGESYFTETLALAKSDIYISPIEKSRETGEEVTPHESTIHYASSVSDAVGRKQGVLVLNLNADYLMAQALLESDQEWQTLFADPQGYVYSKNQSEQKTNIFTDVSFGLAGIQGSKSFQSQESDTDIKLSVLISQGDKRDHLGYLVSIAPKVTLFKPIQDYISVSLIIVAVCLFLSLMFAIILSNSLSAPLLRLTEKVKNFSQGDLETPIKAETKNEIGDLSHAMELLRKSMVILMKRSRKV